MEEVHEKWKLRKPHLEHEQESRPARPPLGPQEPMLELWWLPTWQWKPKAVEKLLEERAVRAAAVDQPRVKEVLTEDECQPKP